MSALGRRLKQILLWDVGFLCVMPGDRASVFYGDKCKIGKT